MFPLLQRCYSIARCRYVLFSVVLGAYFASLYTALIAVYCLMFYNFSERQIQSNLINPVFINSVRGHNNKVGLYIIQILTVHNSNSFEQYHILRIKAYIYNCFFFLTFTLTYIAFKCSEISLCSYLTFALRVTPMISRVTQSLSFITNPSIMTWVKFHGFLRLVLTFKFHRLFMSQPSHSKCLSLCPHL